MHLGIITGWVLQEKIYGSAMPSSSGPGCVPLTLERRAISVHTRTWSTKPLPWPSATPAAATNIEIRTGIGCQRSPTGRRWTRSRRSCWSPTPSRLSPPPTPPPLGLPAPQAGPRPPRRCRRPRMTHSTDRSCDVGRITFQVLYIATYGTEQSAVVFIN